jgi:hypothetical protein
MFPEVVIVPATVSVASTPRVTENVGGTMMPPPIGMVNWKLFVMGDARMIVPPDGADVEEVAAIPLTLLLLRFVLTRLILVGEDMVEPERSVKLPVKLDNKLSPTPIPPVILAMYIVVLALLLAIRMEMLTEPPSKESVPELVAVEAKETPDWLALDSGEPTVPGAMYVFVEKEWTGLFTVSNT